MPHPVPHVGKYVALYEWLLRQRGRSATATFDKVEEILGFPLPAYVRSHPTQWRNHTANAVARAIADSGWEAQNVDATVGRVTFIRNR